MSDQLHAPTFVPLRRSSPIRIEQETEWVLQPVWRLGKYIYFFALAENRTTNLLPSSPSLSHYTYYPHPQDYLCMWALLGFAARDFLVPQLETY